MGGPAHFIDLTGIISAPQLEHYQNEHGAEHRHARYGRLYPRRRPCARRAAPDACARLCRGDRGLGPSGEIEIVEIKSSVADFQSDQKWPEYAPFCDRFYFAVAAAFPAQLIPEHCGLIVADGFGGAVIRHPETHKLAPARRKAMTQKFARLAALRLAAASGQLDPAAAFTTF